MGKGRDKRRRKRKELIRTDRVEPFGGEPFGPPGPYAPVRAPLKPKPSPRSGAISLPEPDEHDRFLPEFTDVNIQWQTTAEAKAKDQTERAGCR